MPFAVQIILKRIGRKCCVPAVLKRGYKSFFILGIGALYYVLSGLPVCCLIRKNLIVCGEFDLVCCNDC